MKKELAIDCYVGYSNEFMVSLVKEATEKSLICKLEAKYIDNIYFKSFEKFKKKLDTIEFRVASAIILNRSKEIENVKILAFYLGVKDE